MSTAENKAVFLSYASQDAEAARRICEALRGSGVEVWFDQNELVGGDAWDAKIRKQIGECALFVPVISASTQARLEGYFRIEWKLAAQRTHAMADEKTFLLPVVIDDTRDTDAKVPTEFKSVQWTRLPAVGFGGPLHPAQDKQSTSEPGLEAFSARVKRLLESGEGPASYPSIESRTNPGPLGASPRARRANPLAVAAGIVALLVIVAGAILLVGKKQGSAPGAPVRAETSSLPAEKSSTSSEAQKLIAQIWRIFELQEDGTLEEWSLAEDLGAQAVKLESMNAEAWAAYAAAGWGLNTYQRTISHLGREDALRRAERAIALDPHSHDARFVQANFYRSDAHTTPQAEATLRELLQRRPEDKRVLRVLAYTIRNKVLRNPADAEALVNEALAYLDRAAALPGGDASALTGKCSVLATLGRYEEALTAAEASAVVRNGPGASYWRISLLLFLRGDAEKAAEALNTAPASFWRQERNIVLAERVQLARKNLPAALTTLARLPNEWVDGGSNFVGPRGVLTAEVHRLAGNAEAAQSDLRAAEQIINRRLAATPNHELLLFWKAWVQAWLGDSQEAERTFLLWRQYTGGKIFFRSGFSPFAGGSNGEAPALYVQMGQKGAVLEALESHVQAIEAGKYPERALLLHYRLRFEPTWDPLRGDPRFEAAVATLGASASGGKTK